jgi:hypothetical protein
MASDAYWRGALIFIPFFCSFVIMPRMKPLVYDQTLMKAWGPFFNKKIQREN